MTAESDREPPGGPGAGRDAARPEASEYTDSGAAAVAPTATTGGKAKGPLHRPALLIFAGGVLLVAMAVAGTLWYVHARQFESTDDAFIDTHLVHLASQIMGQVVAVTVEDNQLVQLGQPLVVIDSADTQAHLAQARAQRAQAQAQLANAQGQILVNEAAYSQSQADAAAAQAQATVAALDLARYERLAAINPAAVAEQQLDQARMTRSLTAAQRDAAVRATQVRAAQVAASRTLVTAGTHQVAAAQAQVDEAGISLGYARIASPIVGHVAQKSVAVGQYVQPGTQMLAIVPMQLWITANFKETQLSLMRPGQAVTVAVDACPAIELHGHVDSIQRGAGQAFAILPPENATGNYVKVVQRVPVKIAIDDIPGGCLIGPGMSVEPQVQVR